MTKICVIHGGGFLGTALYSAFKDLSDWQVLIYDRDYHNSLLRKTYADAPFIVNQDPYELGCLHFVCVPTPMNPDGSCFTGIVEAVVSSISKANKDCDIVIKSTVPPGFTAQMAKKHHARTFFNPEFLTEANFIEDFAELPYQFIGSPNGLESNLLEDLFKCALKENGIKGANMIFQCDSTEAEMVKLTRNCYLATRLSYFNEIKQICEKLDICYDQVRLKAGMDKRIGDHYNKIDENTWGGHCLPKDINSLIFVAKNLGVDPKVTTAAWEKNLETNKIRDWEKMNGRAVIKTENK